MATAEEIRAAIQAGPQTQDALDQALLTYTPEQMAAAFPEFGGVAQYASAAADAANRADAANASREKASGAGSSTAVNGNDPKALRAAIQAGPQTQDALDKALLTYTPAQLQAAFPEFGNVSNWNSASQDAYNRQEVKDREGRRTDPSYVSSAPTGGALISRVPQSEIDAGKAAAQQAVKDGTLSQADYDWLVWHQNEINPITQRKVSEDYAAQGANPYDQKNWVNAKEANARAARQNTLYVQSGQPTQSADWTVPGYEARQTATDAAEKARIAKLVADNAALGNKFTTGGGLLTGGTPTVGTPTVGTPTGTPTGGLLTTPPNLPPRPVGGVSTFASTSLPTGAASQYSRQYGEQDLKNIRDWWSKSYGNREQAMSDMTKYGITTQDLSNAIGEPYSQLASYLKAGGAQSGFGGAIEGAGGLFRRAADMAQQPGIQFGSMQGLLSDPTSQLAQNILGRDTQYQQTAPVMGSGKWGMPSIAPGTGLLAPDYWLAAKTAAAQKTEPAAPPPVVQPYPGY